MKKCNTAEEVEQWLGLILCPRLDVYYRTKVTRIYLSKSFADEERGSFRSSMLIQRGETYCKNSVQMRFTL